MTRRLAVGVVASVLASAIAVVASGASMSERRVFDLDNRVVDPFKATPGIRATVLVFTSVDCPVSNRYAPEIRRLHDEFQARGVAFWLVYPNPRESADQIRKHLAEFGYPLRAVRDPQHDLAAFARATVTPEAAVYDRVGALVYHGRIDDRYPSLTVQRPAATRRDLHEAITEVLAGKPASTASEPAVGCFIADFVP